MCLDDYQWGQRLNDYLDSIQEIFVKKLYHEDGITEGESEKLWRFGWDQFGQDLDFSRNPRTEKIARSIFQQNFIETPCEIRNYKFRNCL